MKKKKFINVLSAIALIGILFTSIVYAQDEPQKENSQNKNQIKNELKVMTQIQTREHRNHFIDLNNDGYNDNAPDIDGDGIPNGRDEDYVGAKFRKNGRGFIDLNGDGINDNAFDVDGDGIPNGRDPDFVRPQDGTGMQNRFGKNIQTKFGGNKYGPGNGTGMKIGPKDGTGYGAPTGAGTGSGTCDGTGPKGKRGGKR